MWHRFSDIGHMECWGFPAFRKTLQLPFSPPFTNHLVPSYWWASRFLCSSSHGFASNTLSNSLIIKMAIIRSKRWKNLQHSKQRILEGRNHTLSSSRENMLDLRMEKMINTQRTLVGKPQRRDHLKYLCVNVRIILNWIFDEMWGCGLDTTGLMVAFCGHNNEPSGSITADQVSTSQTKSCPFLVSLYNSVECAFLVSPPELPLPPTLPSNSLSKRRLFLVSVRSKTNEWDTLSSTIGIQATL
jgi:hypothetical protein